MTILNALKPAFRAFAGRAAALSGAERRLPSRGLPVFRLRVFTIFFYMALSITVVTLLVANTGVSGAEPARRSEAGLSVLKNWETDAAARRPEGSLMKTVAPVYTEIACPSKKIDVSVDAPFIVNIRLGRKLQKVWADSSSTVGQVLSKAGISTDADDMISHPKQSLVAQNMNITVHSVTYRTLTYKQSFAGKVIHTTTPLLARGRSRVESKGKKGERMVTSKVKFVDGVKKQETVLSQVVTQKPLSATVAVGTAIRTPISKITFASHTLNKSGLPVRYSRVVTGLATAYSAHRGAGTASGMRAGVGRVAVNTSVFPYGTRLYIVGADGSFVYGYAVAADTGGFARKKRVLVDLYFNTYSESCAFGARRVKIYVLD